MLNQALTQEVNERYDALLQPENVRLLVDNGLIRVQVKVGETFHYVTSGGFNALGGGGNATINFGVLDPSAQTLLKESILKILTDERFESYRTQSVIENLKKDGKLSLADAANDWVEAAFKVTYRGTDNRKRPRAGGNTQGGSKSSQKVSVGQTPQQQQYSSDEDSESLPPPPPNNLYICYYNYADRLYPVVIIERSTDQFYLLQLPGYPFEDNMEIVMKALNIAFEKSPSDDDQLQPQRPPAKINGIVGKTSIESFKGRLAEAFRRENLPPWEQCVEEGFPIQRATPASEASSPDISSSDEDVKMDDYGGEHSSDLLSSSDFSEISTQDPPPDNDDEMADYDEPYDQNKAWLLNKLKHAAPPLLGIDVKTVDERKVFVLHIHQKLAAVLFFEEPLQESQVQKLGVDMIIDISDDSDAIVGFMCCLLNKGIEFSITGDIETRRANISVGDRTLALQVDIQEPSSGSPLLTIGDHRLLYEKRQAIRHELAKIFYDDKVYDSYDEEVYGQPQGAFIDLSL